MKFNSSAKTVSKKRKSTPQKAFPSGYRDSSPGVIVGFEFGQEFGYIKRAVSCSISSSDSSVLGSLDSSIPSPQSSTLIIDGRAQCAQFTSTESCSIPCSPLASQALFVDEPVVIHQHQVSPVQRPKRGRGRPLGTRNRRPSK